MAASELMVQPHVAHAHDDTGATDRHKAAAPNRLIEQIMENSRGPDRKPLHGTIDVAIRPADEATAGQISR
jgi:hypothetical protein